MENLIPPVEVPIINPESEVFELSETEIEEVLKQVVDINEQGTAFTGVRKYQFDRSITSLGVKNSPSLEEVTNAVLSHGILGTFGLKESEIKEGSSFKDAIKQKWVNSRKEGWGGNLFVNIVGQDIEKISDSFAGEGTSDTKDYIGFIMDLSTFREQIPTSIRSSILGGEEAIKYGKGRSKHIRAYWGNDSNKKIGVDIVGVLHKLGIQAEILQQANYKEIIDMLEQNCLRHQDVSMTSDEYGEMIKKVKEAKSIENIFGIKEFDYLSRSEGYQVGHRVSPRYIRGIVLPRDGRIAIETLLKDVVAGMAKTSKEKKQNVFLPVYDPEGNLLWPKEISHEEIVEIHKK